MAAKVTNIPDYHYNCAWSLAAMGGTNEEIATAMGVAKYDKDGNVKPIKIEKTKKQVPPDVGAQCFWLKNRQRDKWQDRPEVIPDTGADDGDQVQFYLPDNGRDG